MTIEGCKPHAVVFPYPTQGHINPLMQLAQALACKGFTITFVNTEYHHSRILKAQPQATNAGVALAHDLGRGPLHLVGLPDGLPDDFDRLEFGKGNYAQFIAAVENMGGVLEQLIQDLNTKSPPVTCIVSDSFCSWTQGVADRLNIPRVFVWTQSAAAFQVYSRIDLLVSNEFFPYKDKGHSEEAEPANLITYMPGLPPLHPADIPTLLRVESVSDYTCRIMSNQFERLKDADWVFINSFEELESKVFETLKSKTQSLLGVGPACSSAYMNGQNMRDKTVGTSLWQEKQSVDWLDRQSASSVLYISFGSLVVPTPSEIQEIAFGLKASGQPFLWVLRHTSSCGDTAELLPQGFLEDTKEQGVVLPWCSQLQVLSHPAVGGVLTHCGWNSTLESIMMGVPMLGWPRFSDQVTNCKFIVDEWKVGMAFKKQEDGTVGRGEVERVVRKLMQQEEESKEMRKRVAELKGAARRAMEEGGSSDRNLQLFVAAMEEMARKPANLAALEAPSRGSWQGHEEGGLSPQPFEATVETMAPKAAHMEPPARATS